MNLDLSKLNEETNKFEYSLDDSWVKVLVEQTKQEDSSFELISPLKLSFTVNRPCAQEDTFMIDESIDATLKVTCSRCLAEFNYELKDQLYFTAVNRESEGNSKESKMPKDSDSFIDANEEDYDDDINTIFLSGTMLDLNKLLLDTIYLNLPYAFICKSDCKGLCSTCGTNRNTKECDCNNEDKKENAFASLKNLRF